MIPGLKKTSELGKISPKALAPSKSLPFVGVSSNNIREGSPKRSRDKEVVALVNTQKLIQYGATHLGPGVGNQDVWLRGGGGVLNLDMEK